MRIFQKKLIIALLVLLIVSPLTVCTVQADDGRDPASAPTEESAAFFQVDCSSDDGKDAGPETAAEADANGPTMAEQLPHQAGENEPLSEPADQEAGETSSQTENASSDREQKQHAVRRTVTSRLQAARMIGSSWDEHFFQEAVIDPRTGRVTVDGERSSLKTAFGLDMDAAAMESADAAEAFFEDTPYEAEIHQDGKVHVTAPYQTCCIVVRTEELTEDYGASTVLFNQEDHQYVLQFPDQETTETAYQQLSGTYDCYVDQVLSLENKLECEGSEEGSWGAEYMGMSNTEPDTTDELPSIQVAVIDTGCDTGNSFFEGRTFSAASRNIQNNGTDIHDVLGHGTHVAGILHSCCPKSAELMVLQVYSEKGTSTLSVLDTAIKYALEQGAEVINISLGQNDAKKSLHALDSTFAQAKEAGVPVVCAAGNRSQDVCYMYPASNPDTIAVSAITRNGEFAATFSEQPSQTSMGNGGTGSSYGNGVDFCAPGVNIVSADPGGGTRVRSGTSMSAPHISAAFAWLRSGDRKGSVDELYEELKSLCEDLGDSGRDDLYGWGCPHMDQFIARTWGHAKPTLPGDLDDDNFVTIQDVVLGQRVVVGLEHWTDEQKKAADVTDDEKFTMADVIKINRIVLGKTN